MQVKILQTIAGICVMSALAVFVSSQSASACPTGELIDMRATASATQVAPSSLATSIPPSTHVIYIGERHGVRAHPLAAGCLLADLVAPSTNANSDLATTKPAAANRLSIRPTLIMEHLRRDQQAVFLKRFIAWR